MDTGIIPNVVGGLGNQLFITAGAYVVAKHNNYSLFILNNPLHNNKHNKYNNNYNDTIFKYFGTHINKDITDKNYLSSIGYTTFTPQKVDFGNWNPKLVPSKSVLSGYLQYYPPLQEFETEIQELMLKGLEPIREKINVEENSAFLHIRRGDAHQNLWLYYLTPIDYFIRCVNRLLQNSTNEKPVSRIYVLTDEFEWVKSQDFFKNPIFTFYENDNELESFALMTKCTAGAICGPSTFSWWGAFLGAYKAGAPVFVPKDWIKMKVYNLFPPTWIIEDTSPLRIPSSKWLCINLDERLDRLREITRHMEDLEIEFERIPAIKNSNGALGCMDSHIQCLNTAILHNFPYVIIMEDDCEFLINQTEIDNYINAFLQTDSPVMVFGSTNIKREPYNDIFNRGKNIFSSTCYIVKRFYFETLKKSFQSGRMALLKTQSHNFALDVMWHTLQDKDIWLIPKTKTIQQRPSYSDIQKTFVDYRQNFN